MSFYLLLHCCVCRCVIVSIIPPISSLFKFCLEHSLSSRFWLAFWVPLVHVVGSLFGCYWFTFSVRVWVSFSPLFHVLFSPIFLCSHCLCGFIHSIFAFTGFGRFHLGPFTFIGFVLIVYKSYVFLSLKCCIICTLGLLSVLLYHKFWV